MPVAAYIGLPRNGKTYEVVTEPILNALRAGRRVVSNIAGLQYDLMRELLISEGIAPENIGTIVTVTHEQILEPNFWLTDKDEEQGVKAFIQAGDLLALDEIWRFWNGFSPRDDDGKKRPLRVMNFFRMHGHFADPVTGFTNEIAIITQDIADIHRSVKGVVDQTFLMTKLTALGSEKHYRVDIFSRYKTSGKPVRSIQRTYNPKYFPFYKSNSQAAEGTKAKEQRLDKRGNILLNARFLIVIPVVLLMGIFAFSYLYRYMHPKPKQDEQTTIISSPASPSDSPKPTQLPNAPVVPEPVNTWRIVGFYEKNRTITLVMRNDAGSTRYVVDPNIRMAGLDVGAVLGNDAYSNWSGAPLTRNTHE